MALCKFCTNGVMSDGMACRECLAVLETCAENGMAGVPQNVPLLAEKLGVPADQWGGRCHEISVAFRDRFAMSGRVRRGWRYGYGGQHSWIELDRGIVVDPTWTALRGEPTEVLVTSGTYYDPCGWRSVHGEALVRTAPSVEETTRELIELNLGSVDYVADLLDLYADFYGEDWLTVSIEQAHWLANLPVLRKEGRQNLSSFFAAEVYEALRDAGQKALIPIDAWHYVMDEPYPGEPSRA